MQPPLVFLPIGYPTSSTCMVHVEADYLLRLIVALGLVLLDVLDLLDGLAVVDAVGAVVRLHGGGEGGGRGEAEDKGEGLHVGRHFESGRVSSLTPPPGLL